MNKAPPSPEWDEYFAVLREDAHQLLAWAYSDARGQISLARDEYDITDCLSKAMHERTNDPLTPERFSFYSVHNERPICVGGNRGKDRPKLDIQIERCGMRPKSYYTFEAKRLRDDLKMKAPESLENYLGHEGVCRLISGSYESIGSEAAMLGCMQAHDAQFWLGQICCKFATDIAKKRNRFQVLQQLQPVTIIATLPDEASSVHRRKNGRSIRVLHIFIDCC